MDFLVKSGSGALEYSNRAWSLGERMVPLRTDASANFAIGRAAVWEVTTAGTSIGTPTWPASVTYDTTTVTDTVVVWTARKPGFSSGATADWAFATIFSDYGVAAVINATGGGHRVLLSDNHAQSHTHSTVHSFPGGTTAPCQMISVDDSAAPPVASLAGASITTIGSTTISMRGNVLVEKVSFSSGSSGNTNSLTFNSDTSTPNHQVYRDCNLIAGATGSTSGWQLGVANTVSAPLMEVEFYGGTIEATGVNNKMRANGIFRFENVVAGGAADPTTFITASAGVTAFLEFHGCDFSAWGAALNICSGGAYTQQSDILLNKCKMPAGWTEATVFESPITVPGVIVRMRDCSAGDNQVNFYDINNLGVVRDEQTIVRTSGASDEVTPYSFAMVSTAVVALGNSLRSGPTYVRAVNVGVAQTITVEIVHDSLTALTDAEVWIEVRAKTTSGFPLGSMISDRIVDVMATPAAQTSSSVGWTTTGITNVNKQKLVTASFTPAEVGTYEVFVCLAKASYTIYHDHPDVA